ncbi:MAG: methyltransferase [Pyrinomonadaceae bacterium]
MKASFAEQIPVRIGTPEEFRCVAAVLREASFDEETICRTLKVKDMSKVGTVNEAEVDFSNVAPPLQILIRLFQYLALVPRSEVERVFDRATVDSFLSLGLWGAGEFGDDDFYARVLLYPVAGFFIASDRHSMPDGTEFEPPPDIVFPAIFMGTLIFLGVLPAPEAEEALDLCSGTGIGALVLSRTSKRAVSADITARAAQFARFNCVLNDRENVDVVSGDLYSAVPGRTFDCVVAHPPYVPSIGVSTIWRDGGPTGELLIRQIIEGLPGHLRAGGTFCALTLGLDTKTESFEERVRSWLKESADEFDILFGFVEERQPAEVLKNISQRDPTGGSSALQELEKEFERLGIVKMPYGVLFMRRASDPANHQPWTARQRLNKETNGFDFEAAFVLHDRLSQPGFVAELIDARPQLAARLQVKVTHVVSEGGLVPAGFMFEIDRPFETAAEFDGWMVPLLARLNGQTTLAEIYEEARARSEIPADFQPEHFCDLVSRAMGLGFISLT